MRHLVYINFLIHLPLLPRSAGALLTWVAVHLLLLTMAKRIR
ncbi:MAG TPA: hypothetical protein VIM73_18830 [Polyangiaceae bacterium]